MLGITEVKNTGEGLMVKGGQINATTAMPDRIAPGRLYIFYQTASICPSRRAPEAIQRESHRIINTGRAFIYDSLT